MVQIDIEYTGDLRCQAKHQPSKTLLITDAPLDNMGKGESFSPTDLVATALASCMVTTMAIAARKTGMELTGVRATVTKEMISVPQRKIGRLAVTIFMPPDLPEERRKPLENAALACPVHRSMDPSVEMPVKFVYEEKK